MTLQTIKKREQFLDIQKNGTKWVSHGLIIQAKANDLNVMRVGYTVTKRVSKSAVTRNRIKRRMREAARLTLPEYAKDSMDYVFIGRVETETRDFEQLCRDIKWCLDKMGYGKADV